MQIGTHGSTIRQGLGSDLKWAQGGNSRPSQTSLTGTDTSPSDGRYYNLIDSATNQAAQFAPLNHQRRGSSARARHRGSHCRRAAEDTAFAQGASNSYYNLLNLQPKHRRGGVFWANGKQNQRKLQNQSVTPTPDINDGKYHIVRLTSVKMPSGNAINVYLDENPTPVNEPQAVGQQV